jgi:hypothetical protein
VQSTSNRVQRRKHVNRVIDTQRERESKFSQNPSGSFFLAQSWSVSSNEPTRVPSLTTCIGNFGMLLIYSFYIEKDFNSCMRTRLSHAPRADISSLFSRGRVICALNNPPRTCTTWLPILPEKKGRTRDLGPAAISVTMRRNQKKVRRLAIRAVDIVGPSIFDRQLLLIWCKSLP